LCTSAKDHYPPDFINQLIKKINDGEKPYIIAFGKDNFLNNFLQNLKTIDKIYLKLIETPDYVDESKFIFDDYNWNLILKDNIWNYTDKYLTLSSKIEAAKKPLIKIECPFLNKFIEYLLSLNGDPEKSNIRFLNSKLAKLVIEEDKGAIEIWEEETNTDYESAPTYFVAVEVMPEPIGGIDTIKNCLFFPETLSRVISYSKIYLLAVINKTGQIIELEPIKSDYSLFEKIANFAVCFPQWKAGKQRGENVVVQFSVPLKFDKDCLPATMEYKFDKRSFYSYVPNTTRCYLFEKGFIDSNSIKIEFNSKKYYELLLSNPDIMDIVYKALYLSNFTGLGFKVTSKSITKYYFISKN
jgi:hypothetical protein